MEKIKEGYTRVSEILQQWNQLSHIPKHILDNKCRIGTSVHENIYAHLSGIFIQPKEDEKGYFDSWLKWYEEVSSYMVISNMETRLYCDEWKITGCIDGIIENQNTGESFILDYKTSSSPHLKTWALQAAFYEHLTKNTELEAQNEGKAWFLHLQKSGEKAIVIEVDLNLKLWEIAQSAIRTFRYFND